MSKPIFKTYLKGEHAAELALEVAKVSQQSVSVEADTEAGAATLHVDENIDSDSLGDVRAAIRELRYLHDELYERDLRDRGNLHGKVEVSAAIDKVWEENDTLYNIEEKNLDEV